MKVNVITLLISICVVISTVVASTKSDVKFIKLAKRVSKETGADVNEFIQTGLKMKAYNEKVNTKFKAKFKTAPTRNDEREKHSKRVLSANYFYQGDIRLSEAQFSNLISYNGPNYTKWSLDRPITYFSTACTESFIDKVFASVNQHTCLRFQRVSTKWDAQLNVIDLDDLCYSRLGKVYTGQEINLGHYCCSHATALHEVFHSLGVMHEQMRYDRDDHIKILWDNIKPGLDSQFEKADHKGQYIGDGLEYDYKSIMQYNSKEFGRESGYDIATTMLQKDGSIIPINRVAQFSDWQEINIAYGCPSYSCPQSKISCSNDGYVNPNKCDECVCRDGTQSCRNNEDEEPTKNPVGSIPGSIPASIAASIPGSIRLVPEDGRTDQKHGRLEIRTPRGTWSTICDPGFSVNAARVVCHELGVNMYRSRPFVYAAQAGSGPVLEGGVRCTGSENSFRDCAYAPSLRSCNHDEDVGVLCPHYVN